MNNQQDKTAITFSIDSILNLRAEAFAKVRYHNAMVAVLAAGIESLDQKLQSQLAVRGIVQQTELLASARHLSNLLDGEGISL